MSDQAGPSKEVIASPENTGTFNDESKLLIADIVWDLFEQARELNYPPIPSATQENLINHLVNKVRANLLIPACFDLNDKEKKDISKKVLSHLVDLFGKTEGRGYIFQEDERIIPEIINRVTEQLSNHVDHFDQKYNLPGPSTEVNGRRGRINRSDFIELFQKVFAKESELMHSVLRPSDKVHIRHLRTTGGEIQDLKVLFQTFYTIRHPEQMKNLPEPSDETGMLV